MKRHQHYLKAQASYQGSPGVQSNRFCTAGRSLTGHMTMSTTRTTPDRFGRLPQFGLLALLACTTLLACGGDPPIVEPPVAPVAVGLSISPLALSLIVGGEGRLTARAYDAKDQTINASITWSSADPAIATIRGLGGNVTAIAVGTTRPPNRAALDGS